jgi:glycerol-3-phosphate acyltransferase PlsY
VNGLIAYAAFVIGSYLLGSIPTGLPISRWAKGVDIREFGSGNTGMANVMRTVGIIPGIFVLLLDAGKGMMPILLIRMIGDRIHPGLESVDTLPISCGFAALIGHNWSIFLKFKGGKGVATGLGTLIALSPISFIIGATLALPSMVVWRYMSLASLVGTISGGLTLTILAFLGFHPLSWSLYGIIGALIIAIRHRENIRRLRMGTETALGQPGLKKES